MHPGAFYLKVVLPSRPALERTGVVRLTVLTPEGLLQLPSPESNLIAAILPGFIAWETKQGEKESVVIDRGVLIKADNSVLILTRNSSKAGRLDQTPGQKSPRRLGKAEADLVLNKMKEGFVESVVKFADS